MTLLQSIGLTPDQVRSLVGGMPQRINVVAPEQPSRVLRNRRGQVVATPRAFHYGYLKDIILGQAKRRGTFTVEDIPAVRDRNHLNALLSDYVKRGYLQRVRRGIPNRQLAVFSLPNAEVSDPATKTP